MDNHGTDGRGENADGREGNAGDDAPSGRSGMDIRLSDISTLIERFQNDPYIHWASNIEMMQREEGNGGNDDEGQVDSDDDSDFEEEYRQDFDRGQARQLFEQLGNQSPSAMQALVRLISGIGMTGFSSPSSQTATSASAQGTGETGARGATRSSAETSSAPAPEQKESIQKAAGVERFATVSQCLRAREIGERVHDLRLRARGGVARSIVKRINTDDDKMARTILFLRKLLHRLSTDSSDQCRVPIMACTRHLRYLATRIFQKQETNLQLANFACLNGPDTLARLLLCLSQRRSDLAHDPTNIAKEILALLRELLYAYPHLPNLHFVGSDEFVHALLNRLTGKQTFDLTVGLIEEIMSARGRVLSLCRVPNIIEIIGKQSQRQLSLFMRVLSPLVSGPQLQQKAKIPSETIRVALGGKGEPDGGKSFYCGESLSLLRVARANISRNSLGVISANHALLLKIPLLLERIAGVVRRVALACSTPNSEGHRQFRENPLLPSNAFFHSDLSVLVGGVAGDGADDWGELGLDDVEFSFPSTPPRSTPPGDDLYNAVRNHVMTMPLLHVRSLDFKSLTIAVNLVECLFTLSMLCAGNRRYDVQRRLAAADIMSTIEMLFDHIDWTPVHTPAHGPHGPGCQCNPQSALKIQCLRLLHNYIDRNTFEEKLSMLSPSQRDAIFELEAALLAEKRGEKVGVQACIDRLETEMKASSQTYLPGSPGSASRKSQSLISKLAQVRLEQKGDSPLRFWLGTCIESFLKSGHHSQQILVAVMGNVLPKLLEEISTYVGSGVGGLQSSMDLIAEIVRFSPYVLRMLERYLITSSRFERFMNVVRENLVDSNVFVRSLFLTVATAHANPHWTHLIDNSRIVSFLEEKKFDILYDLCLITSVENISQENLCCVNSAVIILLLEKRRSNLASAIATLRERSHTSKGKDATENAQPANKVRGSKTKNATLPAIENLRRMLWFWKKYYNFRALDRRQLQASTHISFQEYNELVSELTIDGHGRTDLHLLQDEEAHASFAAWRAANEAFVNHIIPFV
eukprot:g5239.t1